MPRVDFKTSLVTSYLDRINSKPVSAQNTNVLAAQYSQKAVDEHKQGQLYSQEGQFDKAIDAFTRTVQMQPDYAEAYLNLARTYKTKGDLDNAVQTFEKYLTMKPNDEEALALLGDVYKQQGYYKKAEDLFKKALAIEPKDDYANRNLSETENRIKFVYDPRSAIAQKDAQVKKNIAAADAMAKAYLTPDYFKGMQDVQIGFDETAKLGGYSNIAQYEHDKQKIAVTDDFIWANPALTGAYLAHEYVHAKDNDAYSSIREEQDAFRVQADFWLKYGNGIKDPEMDYVVALYKDSAEKLDARVREIYAARDKSMPETSPNHPPSSHGNLLSASLNNDSQPLKKYDIIASRKLGVRS